MNNNLALSTQQFINMALLAQQIKQIKMVMVKILTIICSSSTNNNLINNK